MSEVELSPSETGEIEPVAKTAVNAAEQLEETRAQLCEVAESTSHRNRPEIFQFANMLVKLLDLSEFWHDESEARLKDVQQLPEFVTEGIAVIEAAMADDPEALIRIKEQLEKADQQWGEYLELLDGSAADGDFGDLWLDDAESEGAADDDEEFSDSVAIPTADEVAALLSQVSSAGETEADQAAEPAPETTSSSSDPEEDASSDEAGPDDVDVEMNDELREAFLDDATRCLQVIEDALLRLEADPANQQAVTQIGRELHTLKGAAGSVGLAQLAAAIHQTEESLQKSNDGLSREEVEQLFAALDGYRQVVNQVAEPLQKSTGTTRAEGAEATTLTAPNTSFDDRVGDESSVRIKQTQLTRLMDMLAELVMLRNRRDSELAQLKGIQKDLMHAAARLRECCDNAAISLTLTTVASEVTGGESSSARLTEIAGDVLESAQQLHDVYQPIVDTNQIVTEFTGQLRQELVELRRVPVASLFRRLRRAVRDAARVEGKRVELIIEGEQTGMERSVQERLYEPLLHVVRNCVSHGVEAADDRRRGGKSEVGTITLSASAGPDLLRIEIRDDGRGLDYDALRRRGIEKGLIRADQASSEEELAQLIFHPGFSTKQSASQIAGRGVGMDVVAEAIGRMRGWIEIDSVAGQGTSIRLTLPQPSVIGHAMVFRSSGQLFAVPMQFVQAAEAIDGDVDRTPFAALLGQPIPQKSDKTQTLTLHRGQGGERHAESDSVALLVDEILGPEELVIRPLPSLLKQHPMFSGATVSGTGQMVLLVDCRRVFAKIDSTVQPVMRVPAEIDTQKPKTGPPVVLVVDDSRSARKRLLQLLQSYNCKPIEARDGAEAVGLLKEHRFEAIFSDFEMPHLDGIGLLKEVHSGRHGKGIPTIVISSRKEASFRNAALDAGAEAYLTKPIDGAALRKTIKSISAMSRLIQS